MMKRYAAYLGLPLLLAANPAQAVTVFQTNFDSIAVPSGSYVILPTAEGWTATAGDGIEIQNHAAGEPFSETNLVELDSNNNSAMSRTIDAGTYTLSFYYSARPNVPAASNGIDVLINGVSIFNITGDGGAGTVWLPQSLSFGVNASSTLTFAAIGTSDSLGGYLDNVALAGVPEPATWAMMLGGFALVGAATRRRTRTAVTYA
ncbi:PEPxxWA-CTERM sorting domain-containing protein [Sphingomonas sp. ID1715]|uniref:PEPxxWA-CTERM sorting domain-containing protein n=1 Tax=Sphingomonas sp. ID1715 TaxID=1656898 RepID=UPI001487DDA1|nr:PEPxxWA-CTERM sorting domain-containing protein [Sphingomonas sp. ID1715]NNM76674.1 PEPxxWA-CTERM sorting domain-containing protein [Sphingomonas sp. ID1715]